MFKLKLTVFVHKIMFPHSVPTAEKFNGTIVALYIHRLARQKLNLMQEAG
tara:strand:+ start:190 stop:339 length:150 start_codon:yes stop_codon:yes gene_type:complete